MRAWWVPVWLGGLLVSAAVAGAEDVTLTTYYPSPRGVYDDLRSNSLEVAGPLQLLTQGRVQPACDASRRGALWFQQDVPAGQILVDVLQFCSRVGDRYQWIAVVGSGP